jgi:hypothetical protein
MRGEALLDLAEVMRLAGDVEESAAAADEAFGLFEAKGNLVLAQRAQAVRDETAVEHRPA